MAIADWLTRPGGPVAPENLTLLVSDVYSLTPGSRVHGEASRPQVATAVLSLVERRDVDARDRLYVYFAGHGLRTDPLNEIFSQDVLALTDFTAADPAATTVAVHDLVSKLRLSWFGIVVVITDACRDLRFRRPFRPGTLGFDPLQPEYREHFPRVYLLQATVPGGVAHGSQTNGLVRGDFTSALLNGLRGDATAKTFDETRPQPYVVRWSTLTEYVEAAAAHQRPRPYGEGDFVLASFPDGWFDDVTLSITATGNGDGPLSVNAHYRVPASPVDGAAWATGPAPLKVSVPPRRHRVVASDGHHRGWRFVDAYTDMDITVDLEPEAAPGGTVSWGPIRRGSGRGQVEFYSDDPADVGQIFSMSGKQVGRLVSGTRLVIPAGSYSGVWLGLAGRHRQTAIEVDSGDVIVWRPDAEPVGQRLSAAGLLVRSQRQRMAQRSGGARLCLSGATAAPPDTVTVHGAEGEWQSVPLHRDSAAGGWIVSADTLPAGRVSFLHEGHRVVVPVMAGVVTAVALGQTICVGLFDKAVVRADGRELLLIDRVQRLVAAGYPEAADLLLSQIDHGVQRIVPSALHGAGDLADRVPLRDRPYLLAARPWAVFLDHPANVTG
ncbi:hypothetical protein AMIS_40170 [Actinoplanes missouriensis 431]|uniref:Peptidase C14 caspase domain-containing protein n=2 Tax=Actinoplanes missouriensis TaxID=1866 RepID=I0H8A0_ACTM4|nr:hypothetical protein AMIS_40170 [Actinoplanes missouriensis 431]